MATLLAQWILLAELICIAVNVLGWTFNVLLVLIPIRFSLLEIGGFRWFFKVFIDPKTDEFTCEKNDNPCGIRACQCDVELVNNLVLAAGDESYNVPSLTEYGGFNVDRQCVSGGGSGIAGKPDQCCGDYPKRFPYFEGEQKSISYSNIKMN